MSGKAAVWFFLIFFFSRVGFAQEPTGEISQLNNRVVLLEKKLATQEMRINAQAEARESTENIDAVLSDWQIDCGITFVLQGTRNANTDILSENGEDVTDASYSVDLGFEKRINDNGKAFINLGAGEGAGVSDEIKAYSGVNSDAADSDGSVALTEVWYEHCFESLPAVLIFGKIDAAAALDCNAYANDECTQFLGQMFKNSPVIEFPDDNVCGVSGCLQPVQWLDLRAQVLDADADWEDVFDDVFTSGELNIKPNFWEKAGNYRIYAWLNNKGHTRWIDYGKTKEKGLGFGGSLDQEITDNLGLFCRWGRQSWDVFMNGEDYSLEQAWSIGGQLRGNAWGRGEDILALGVGQVKPSNKYKEVNSLDARTETHLELYYNLNVNDSLRVTPDLQVIWEPYGGDAANGDKTIFVAGLRTQIDF